MLETVYTVMLVFQSLGIFFNVHLKRLAILSKPTSPDAKNIFVTTPDDSKALPFFILAGADFTFSFSSCG